MHCSCSLIVLLPKGGEVTAGMTLLIVDVPNLTRSLYEEMYLTSPRWDKLADWAWRQACRTQSDLHYYAFLNIPLPDEAASFEVRQAQIEALLRSHYDVVVNEKEKPDDDVDEAMVSMIHAYIRDYDLQEVIIVSHDMANFAGIVHELEVMEIACTMVLFPWRVSRSRRRVQGLPQTRISPADIPDFLQEAAPGTFRSISLLRKHIGPPTPLPPSR